MECDKSGSNLVTTFDCCFHPLSLRYAHARKEFLDLAINITTDAVKNSYKKSGIEVEFIGGYTILRGVPYRNGTPKALLVSRNTRMNCDEKEEKTKNIPSDAISRVDSAVTSVEHSPSPGETTSSRVGEEAAAALVPKYKIVEQGVFDMADHAINSQTSVLRRPKYITVNVYLDKTASAADINLDVSETELKIVPDAKCRYNLEVKLPYSVNSHKGNARFDKKQGALIVKLPVVA